MSHRHLLTGVTLLVLCGVLAIGFYLGYNSLFSPLPKSVASSNPTSSCTTAPVKNSRLQASAVQVSVFNAGDRGGLAGDTMVRLTKRGFRPGDVGNAPTGTVVRRVQVWATTAKDPAAQLVARQFGPTTTIKVTSQDLGPGVDVVVGNKFHHLVKKAPRSVRVVGNEQVCLPTN
ncbi:MAG: LytR C-terminal domain-containing protein [Nocardioidaceae bacterium]